ALRAEAVAAGAHLPAGRVSRDGHRRLRPHPVVGIGRARELAAGLAMTKADPKGMAFHPIADLAAVAAAGACHDHLPGPITKSPPGSLRTGSFSVIRGR